MCEVGGYNRGAFTWLLQHPLVAREETFILGPQTVATVSDHRSNKTCIHTGTRMVFNYSGMWE